MARTYSGVSGNAYYVKTAAQIALAWPGTVINGVEIGSTGVFQFAGLVATLEYFVFLRATAEPLATDLNVGLIELELPTANAISSQIANDQIEGENGWDDGPIVTIAANAATAATEVVKIPRAAAALTAGGTTTKSKVSASTSQLVERLS